MENCSSNNKPTSKTIKLLIISEIIYLHNALPGIVSVKTTPNTCQTGHWKILMSAPKSHGALKEVGAQIQTQPQLFPDICPIRQRKPIKSMPLANQNAWFQQNKDFTATPPPKPNVWLKHNICTIRTKPVPTKVNYKSTSTLNTTSSNPEELDTLQQMLIKLQSAEVENKKMRDSFAVYGAKKR